jgi:hypothetical protein
VYAGEQSKIEAEEALELISALKAGSGRMARTAHDAFIRELQMRRTGGQLEHGHRPRSLDQLSKLGVVVIGKV